MMTPATFKAGWETAQTFGLAPLDAGAGPTAWEPPNHQLSQRVAQGPVTVLGHVLRWDLNR